MPNNIVTQELAGTVVFDTGERIPIVKNGRILTKLSGLLGEGSGSVVSAIVPSMNEPVKGSAVDPDSNINTQKVNILVEQWNISAPYARIDETLNLNTFQSQMSEPNAIKLAAHINADIFNVVAGGAI